MDNGWRAIALAVHLVQTAGFETRRHDEHICAGFYLMREFLVKTNLRTDHAWKALRQTMGGFLHLHISTA